ncbi:MAG: ROK family protein [Fimbriimonadaceae bacterium]|nr:ROK family protein [Fimbriimonadaceae bacterium]QYK59373.1 MAG: ROK family protein [Fimbriimonadaceae bacterium]
MADCVIGVDLGGTNVRAQAIDRSGESVGDWAEGPSRAQEGVEATVAALVDVVRRAGGSPRAVGLAIPGHVDDEGGMVRWAPNFGFEKDGVFHSWRDVALRKPLEAELGVPVRMGNDANCAAFGEYVYGSGRGTANCLVLLTLGTGVGGGVVLGPRSVGGKTTGPVLMLGGNLGGAELGHACIAAGGLDCNAGSYGSLEAYCQRDSIVRRAQHRLQRGRSSMVRDMVDADLAEVTPWHLSQAAEKGDALAIEVWAEVGRALGAGIGTFINIFAPDVLAVGGQIAKAGKWLLDPARQEAENVAVPSLFQDCRIVLAERIDDAGVLGSAALAWEVL